MSYQDPYYHEGAGNQYGTHPDASYNQHNYNYNNLHYNPYTQPSHPTYDQSGYDTGGQAAVDSTDDLAQGPQRRPTDKSVASTLHRRKDTYPPAFTAPKAPKSASLMRQYRYNHQGRLWTKGGRGRCFCRFFFCTLITAVFLVVSIILAFLLWVRPPAVFIGSVAPVSSGSSPITVSNDPTGGVSFEVKLALNITIDNPNSFSVNLKKITAQLTYPINNVPIGGGNATDIKFPAHTRTEWHFPFNIQYSPSNDPGGNALSDLVSKCGAKQNLNINYKITPDVGILFVFISPTISNSFDFPCPFDPSKLGGDIGGLAGGQ